MKQRKTFNPSIKLKKESKMEIGQKYDMFPIHIISLAEIKNIASLPTPNWDKIFNGKEEYSEDAKKLGKLLYSLINPTSTSKEDVITFDIGLKGQIDNKDFCVNLTKNDILFAKVTLLEHHRIGFVWFTPTGERYNSPVSLDAKIDVFTKSALLTAVSAIDMYYVKYSKISEYKKPIPVAVIKPIAPSGYVLVPIDIAQGIVDEAAKLHDCNKYTDVLKKILEDETTE